MTLELSQMTPHVGTAREYLYRGHQAESHRYGYCYAFHLFTGGGATMKVGERTIPLDKGTLVFIRPGVPHAFHVSADAPVYSHNVYCDLWQWDNFVSDLVPFTFLPNAYQPANATLQPPCPELDRFPVVVSLAAFPHLFDNFAHLSRTAHEPRPFRQMWLDSLIFAWLLELHHALFSPYPKDRRILRILREIDAYPERTVNHEEWSEACGLKKTYFYKLFKQETGIPIHEYVIRERLKKAAVLLQETETPVTEVAELTGYSSIHHFTRQFKARFGVNPSQYRRSSQHGPQQL